MPDINLVIQLITTVLIAYIVWKTHGNALAIKAVHSAVNSRLDELVAEIRISVFNKGVEEGRNQVIEEQKLVNNGNGGRK
jgi:hypothetical protein